MKPNALTPTTSTWRPPSPERRGESPHPRLAALRAAKAALLPRAAALAGEGCSYQEIAAVLGVAKSTVCNWLRDRPLGRAAARSLGTPRMTARLAARYESVYRLGAVGERQYRRNAGRSPQVISGKRFAAAGMRFHRRSPFGNVGERSAAKEGGWYE